MIYLASLVERMEDKVKGYNFISRREELDKLLADNTQANRIIIRGDFARNYFTPTGLYKYIDNAKRLNPSIIIEIEDTKTLTTQDFIDKFKNIRSIEELIYMANAYPKELLDTIGFLAGSQTKKDDELLRASSLVSRLQSDIDNLKALVAEKDDIIRTEQENKERIASKFDVLCSRIRYQYGVELYKDKMFTCDKNSFDKVIYIKELTRVQYVDTFVQYLQEILKLLYTMPTRLVVVEPYYATAKVSLYPKLVPHYSLKERDVLSGNVLMLGMQPKVMGDILQNPSHVSILIVLDRAGYLEPHITGSNVEYFYTASDVSDIPAVVPRTRIISYNKDTLFIPYIQDFNKLDDSEKLAKYSSMSITKKIISLIEGGV